MQRVMKAIDRVLYGIEGVVVLGCMAAATLIGFFQVVLRYVFNAGFHWSEALFVILTVTAMMFAGSRAVREDRHVRVEALSTVMPARTWRTLRFLTNFASLALCAYFFYCGYRYVLFLSMMGTVSPETGIPDWIVYSLVPLVFGFFTLRYVLYILQPPPEPQSTELDAARIGGGL